MMDLTKMSMKGGQAAQGNTPRRRREEKGLPRSYSAGISRQGRAESTRLIGKHLATAEDSGPAHRRLVKQPATVWADANVDFEFRERSPR